MLPAQRINSLIEYFKKRGGATIKELSEMLNVSEMTIRRDLRQLESKGLLTKTHGGAVLASSPHEPAYADKLMERHKTKVKLAEFAVEKFVRSGQVILMEGGTTVTAMADMLALKSDLTVVTNGLITANQLRSMASKSTIMSCGGMLREISGTFVGPAAEAFFTTIHADVAFISASAYQEDRGFTDPNMLESQVKRAMLRSASLIVMLLDSSKMNTSSFITTVDLKDIHIFITDSETTDEQLAPFLEQKIEIHRI